MSEIVLYSTILVIIAIILWLIITRMLKNKKVTLPIVKVSIDMDRLLHALGGIHNIKSMESTNSKASFIVEDTSCVEIAVLKELGATGVVQANQKITAIFGKASKAIVEAIEAKR